MFAIRNTCILPSRLEKLWAWLSGWLVMGELSSLKGLHDCQRDLYLGIFEYVGEEIPSQETHNCGKKYQTTVAVA